MILEIIFGGLVWAAIGYFWLKHAEDDTPLPTNRAYLAWFIFIRGPVCWAAAVILIVRACKRTGRKDKDGGLKSNNGH